MPTPIFCLHGRFTACVGARFIAPLTRQRFQQELARGYDLVGIGSIMPNFQKVKAMVKDARRISPRSRTVLGGFCAGVEDIKQIIPLDHVCVGEGISFMRELRRQIEIEFGHLRELRTRLFGDDLQPRTRLTHYPNHSP